MPKGNSSFNAEQFLNNRSTGQMDTKLPACPAGEYNAQVFKLNVREQEIKKGERAGSVIPILDVTWEILDPQVNELLQIERVTSRQSIFLDTTPEGQLDYGRGKNIGLGKLREALSQNDPEKEWFPNMLVGAMARVKVEHTPSDDPENPYANVTQVTAID